VSRFNLFDTRPVGAVTLVETPVSRSFARKARLSFIVVSLVVWTVAATLLSLRLPLVVALTLGLAIGVACGFAVAIVVRIWPVLRALWHWSVEICLGAVLLASARWLASLMPAPLAVLALLLPPAVVFAIPWTRRRVMAVVWCAVVRHRLRMCFAEFVRTANRIHPATAPLILVARPTPAGERVWIWLRPGLDLTDLDGKTSKLAVACWANEVRVVRAASRFAALVRLDVTRRDPLTATVSSPLADFDFNPATPARPRTAPQDLDLKDIPEPDLAPRQRRSR
jgi:hypothetical protein